MGRATRFGVQITVQRYLEESSSTEKGRRENTGKTEAYVSRLNRKHREFSWFRPVAPAQPSRAVPIALLDGLLVAVALAYSLPGAIGVSRSLGWSPLVQRVRARTVSASQYDLISERAARLTPKETTVS